MPLLLLSVYLALIVVASLIGGLLPLYLKLSHRQMQIGLSFVSGVMLGVALLHLLPHAWLEFGEASDGGVSSLDPVMLWMIGGFLGIFLLERFFRFHQHEVRIDRDGHAHAAGRSADQSHDHAHAHAEVSASALNWGAAFIGMAVHSLLNGVALAASIASLSHDGDARPALAGLGTFLVIFLHKPFDSLTIGTLLAASRASHRLRHGVNLAFAIAVPLGASLFYAGVEASGPAAHLIIGAALALSAGMFLCIALSDLLPELHFHQHDRIALSTALLAGLVLAWAIGLFEGGEHEHGHSHDSDAVEMHDH